MKQIVLALLTALTFAGTAWAEGNAWVVIDGPNLSFEMPGKPVYTTETTKVAEGPAPFHQYIFDEGRGKRIFIIQTTIYPTNHKLPELMKALQISSDAAKSTLDGQRWTSFSISTSNGLPAAEGYGTKNGIEVRMLNVLKGHQIVSVTFGGPKGQTSSPDATRFIRSLVLR